MQYPLHHLDLGFTNVHHLHALYALGSYFFPGDHTALVVGIETVDNTVVMKQDNHGHLVAIKERNNA